MVGDPGKRRGRPQKTSRQELIDTVIEMLEKKPDATISINRLAKERNIAPMSIYNYFKDKDELLHAVSLQLMSELDFDIPQQITTEQIRAWAEQVRQFFLQRPYVISITGWEKHISGGWLKTIAVLARILTDSGLDGERRAEATMWLANEVMGVIYLEVTQQQSKTQLRNEDLNLLEKQDTEALLPMMDYVKTHNGDAIFAFHLQRLLVSVQQYLES